MPANLENSAVATGLEKVSFHSNPKERQRQNAVCAALQVFLPSLGAFLLTYRMIYHPFISSLTSPTCSSALLFFLFYGGKKKNGNNQQQLSCAFAQTYLHTSAPMHSAIHCIVFAPWKASLICTFSSFLF